MIQWIGLCVGNEESALLLFLHCNFVSVVWCRVFNWKGKFFENGDKDPVEVVDIKLLL